MPDFLSGLAKGFTDMFGSGNNPTTGYSSVMGQMGVTPDIWDGATSLEKTGILNSAKGLGLDMSGGLAGGFMNDITLPDLVNSYAAIGSLREAKKNNKIGRTLGNQQIDENNRIKKGREHVSGIFNPTNSLAAGYTNVG